MRLLTVRHVTTYRYSEPVSFGEHRMMFRPRASHDLRLLSTQLEISPPPSSLRWLHDVFDNSVAIAAFDRPSTELRLDSTVSLEHIESVLPEYSLEPSAMHYPFRYAQDEWPDLAGALVRQYPDDNVGPWAASFLKSSGPTSTLAMLESMTQTIRSSLQYVRREEKGVHRPCETLRRGSGSCRDFAVLMMEAVRSLGVAARFVSGYIFVPGDRPSSYVGGGATHAWMQAYLPGAGWVDFDPTNSIVGNRNLIRVAVAFDQRHALPLSGTFVGALTSCRGMDVEVRVDEKRQ